MSKQKQIVIVESFPTDMLAKISIVLRRIGYKTILIYLSGNAETEFYKKAYDLTIPFKGKFLKVTLKNIPKICLYLIKKSPTIIKNLFLIKKLKPYLIIGRANPNWLCFIFKNMFKNYPFVYFPYDIRSFVYGDLQEALKDNIPKFEINAERYCFEKSHGIIHKGHEEELNFLDPNFFGRKVNIKAPILHFPPYCLNDLTCKINPNKLSKKDKEIHLILAGHMDIDDPSWCNMIKEILDQKIHMHFYGKTANLSDEELDKRIGNSELKKLFNNKYLHLHKAVKQEELPNEISKYDFGVIFYHPNNTKKNITMCSANKLASYLEAGLPFICFKNYEYMTVIGKSYGIGISIDHNRLKNLRTILNELDYKKLIKNVEKARVDFEINNHIKRMEAFFNKVIEYKNEYNTKL